MKENTIKEAFSRVKLDILSLKNEINCLKNEIFELKTLISSSTDKINFSTHYDSSTDTSTLPQEIGGFKPQNLDISIGNEGVSTDRQTLRQTDKTPDLAHKNLENDLRNAQEIIGSLDNLKKNLGIQFKKITSQEMKVFSLIYQLEENSVDKITYKLLSLKLNLTESSIRDYVQRMIEKGIPIKKQKSNNKQVLLSISAELKAVAPLSVILKLREL